MGYISLYPQSYLIPHGTPSRQALATTPHEPASGGSIAKGARGQGGEGWDLGGAGSSNGYWARY